MNPRATNQPCPCGSGLMGLRNITTYTGQAVVCRKCRQTAPKREYRESNDQQAKRQAAARRKLEEMRDARGE